MFLLSREAALVAASNAPLFSSSRATAAAQSEHYPFVFDAYADARQSSSFIAGSKVASMCTNTVIIRLVFFIFVAVSIQHILFFTFRYQNGCNECLICKFSYVENLEFHKTRNFHIALLL